MVSQLFWKEKEMTIPKPHSICKVLLRKLSKKERDLLFRQQRNDEIKKNFEQFKYAIYNFKSIFKYIMSKTNPHQLKVFE